MQKATPNKILLIVGLIIAAATPFTVIFLTPALAAMFCVPQNLKGTEICIPNGVPAFLLTAFVPIIIGAILILLSLFKKK